MEQNVIQKYIQRPQTRLEEKLNVLTHGLGILLTFIGFPFLLYKANLSENPRTIIAVSVFGIGLLAAYTFSTIYHAVSHPDSKHRWRILDHIGVFLLIGGSYTAFVQKFLETDTATWFLTIMWSIIGLGVVMKLFFTGRLNKLSMFLYLGLGWMAIFVVKPMLATMPMTVFLFVLAGGLLYTTGVFFFLKDRIPYFHSIWHVFVLLATILQSIGIYLSLDLPG